MCVRRWWVRSLVRERLVQVAVLGPPNFVQLDALRAAKFCSTSRFKGLLGTASKHRAGGCCLPSTKIRRLRPVNRTRRAAREVGGCVCVCVYVFVCVCVCVCVFVSE